MAKVAGCCTFSTTHSTRTSKPRGDWDPPLPDLLTGIDAGRIEAAEVIDVGRNVEFVDGLGRAVEKREAAAVPAANPAAESWAAPVYTGSESSIEVMTVLLERTNRAAMLRRHRFEILPLLPSGQAIARRKTLFALGFNCLGVIVDGKRR
jgi:hypothetical protein